MLKNTGSFLEKRASQKNYLFITVGNEPRLMSHIEEFIGILEDKKPDGLE